MDKISKIKIRVFDPIFKQEVVVLLNYEPDDYRAYEKSMNVKEPSEYNYNVQAFTTHMSSEDEPNIYIIYVRRFNWTIDDQATLIHELIHVVTRIWDANNIHFSPETQEFFAHSVDGLYSLIAKKIHDRTTPKKKKSK